MRRIPYVLTAAALGGMLLAIFWRSSAVESQAQPNNAAQPDKAAAQGPPLPISSVVLFTSGVGYYQREGEVTGNATLDLTFPVREVNDLLKSMVVQDLGGGQVRAVGYDSFDPVDRTLKSFALDLTGDPSFAQLLQQARGEKVEVDFQGQAIKGAIAGVEKQKQPQGKDQIIEVDALNLLTADGLRSLPLASVQRVRFLNPNVDAELKRALEVLARGRDTHKRTVSLSFNGQGKRPVKVAYVVESPVWKTSYRLVLDKEGKPLLQGWAIVDNVSDEDWKDVKVTLVSGRPISFQMNMYQPLYADRPWQQLEMFAQLRPQVYGGDMKEVHDLMVPKAEAAPEQDKAEKELSDRLALSERLLSRRAITLEEHAAVKKDLERIRQGKGKGDRAADGKLGWMSTEAAAGSEVGEYFQYAIKQPVSLVRQRSSMLPIVNDKVEARRFSVYNPAVQPKHPLLGLKLKNTTTAHLMQGPITVFEGDSYAGDARILDLQPGEERLLTYAIDQGVEVEPKGKETPEQLVSVKIVKGVLSATYKLRLSSTYNVKNRTTHDRQVLIEHPIRADWTLLNDKELAERSRDVYRFLVSVPAGKSGSTTVAEESSRVNAVGITSANDDFLQFYIKQKETSPAVKKALEKVVLQRTKLADTRREIEQVTGLIKAIAEDQTRLRANMERVPANSQPYQRYLKKLDEQETQIEQYQERTRTLRTQEEAQRRELDAFLTGLTLED